MNLLRSPVVRFEGVRDERHVDVVVQPCPVVEKHHFAKYVVRVEGVNRDGNTFRTLVVIIVVIIIGLGVLGVGNAVVGVLVDIYIYGIVNDENVLQAAEKVVVVLRKPNGCQQKANDKGKYSFHCRRVNFWKNKDAKVRKIPNLARKIGVKTLQNLKYCHFVSFFPLA